MNTYLTRWADQPPAVAVAEVGVAVIAVVVAVYGLIALGRQLRKVTSGQQPEDILTVAVAAIATAVAAQGMWRFFGDKLEFPPVLRVAGFAFIELTVITSALRARRNMRDEAAKAKADVFYQPRGAGVDGTAMWAFTILSAVLSATDTGSLPAALGRFSAPLVAAWLWKRGMAIEHHKATGRSRINWRFTLERAAVAAGLAEATDRTTGEVDAHRRITKLARAAKNYQALLLASARPFRLRRARARLDAAMERAVEHAALAADPDRQQALLNQLGALYNAAALADLKPQAPWVSDLSPDQVPDQVHDEVPNGSETHEETRSETQVPNEVPDPSTDRSEERSRTRSRTRSKKRSETSYADLLSEAHDIDAAYLDENGRHIPAEKLAKALRIGKPAALELVKQVRGGHIDVAKGTG